MAMNRFPAAAHAVVWAAPDNPKPVPGRSRTFPRSSPLSGLRVAGYLPHRQISAKNFLSRHWRWYGANVAR
jgi:hypothetical protein